MRAVREYFDVVAEKYQSRSNSYLWKHVRAVEVGAISRLLPDLRGLTVLDACCGSGFYTRFLAERGPKKIVAVDISKKMLRSMADLEVEVDRREGDAATMKYNENFDFILCAGGLEFMRDPRAFFKTMATHSSKNASLVVLSPKQGAAGYGYKAFHRMNGMKVHLFSRLRLREVGRDSGWELTDSVSPHPFAIVGLYRKFT